MDNLILQIATTLCLVSGVTCGELISNKLFGYSRKWYLNIIEIFLFITILIIMFNNIYLKELNPLVIFLANFFFGTTAITATRGLTSGAGFFGKRIKEEYTLSKELNEDVIIIGLTRNLLNKGLSKEEIKELLENSGLNKLKTRNTINNFKEEAFGTKENE